MPRGVGGVDKREAIANCNFSIILRDSRSLWRRRTSLGEIKLYLFIGRPKSRLIEGGGRVSADMALGVRLWVIAKIQINRCYLSKNSI